MLTLSLSCLILSLSPEEGEQDADKRRQEEEEEEEEDVLDRQKCQTALASLRHAKWFQVSWAATDFSWAVTDFSTLSLYSGNLSFQPCA